MGVSEEGRGNGVEAIEEGGRAASTGALGDGCTRTYIHGEGERERDREIERISDTQGRQAGRQAVSPSMDQYGTVETERGCCARRGCMD